VQEAASEGQGAVAVESELSQQVYEKVSQDQLVPAKYVVVEDTPVEEESVSFTQHFHNFRAETVVLRLVRGSGGDGCESKSSSGADGRNDGHATLPSSKRTISCQLET
jgi:hypothetical protein